MSQKALPSGGAQQFAPRVDTSSAMNTQDPSIIADTLLSLRARANYLEDFIRKGLDKSAAPLEGTGQPAQVELDDVQTSIRTLAYRAAYSTRDDNIVVPLPEFATVNESFDATGNPTATLREIVRLIPDPELQQRLFDVYAKTGRALAFNKSILVYEGEKGYSRAGTPMPDRAFSIVRAKFDSLSAAIKTNPKATMTVRDDVLDAAKEDPRWDRLFDRLFERRSKNIIVLPRNAAGETPAERLRVLLSEKSELERRVDAGEDLSDDEWDRISSLSMEIEKYSGKGR